LAPENSVSGASCHSADGVGVDVWEPGRTLELLALDAAAAGIEVAEAAAAGGDGENGDGAHW